MSEKVTEDLDYLWHVRSAPQREVRARAEHLKVLSRHSTYVFLGNIAGSMTLAVGLWDTAPPNQLITWVTVMIAFNGFRWFGVRRFPERTLDEAETLLWERRFVISVALSGILWGTAGSVFYVPGQMEHSFFLTLMVVGMCAAATASLSYHRFAYPVFLLPAITPITLHLMAEDHIAASAIGYVIPFYFILLYLLSREIYRTAHESVLGRINSQHQAMFDHLTGVANRRAFEETMDREWYRAMRDEHVLSLVMADIDNFKHWNDTHGHAAGDQVLKAVAMLLEERIRRGADLVARIGGEEFAIVLPDTDLSGAEALAESIRTEVHKLTIPKFDEVPDVTMSFGISSLVPNSTLDAGLLLGLADAAVYEAKRKGKDRIESMESCLAGLNAAGGAS